MIGRLFTCLILVGCSHMAPQVSRYKEALPKDEASAYIIPKVPYFQQEQYHCGPATMAMILNHYGQSKDPSDLVELMYTKKVRGTFQQDMISAARRSGMMAIPIYNFKNLVKEIKHQHPVIAFMNLGFDWYPMWHYALVYGFDFEDEVMVMHSGLEKSKRWDMIRFERSWKRGDYWGLVVFPPHQTAATASEHEHIRSAAALEASGHLEASQVAYHAIKRKWPKSYKAFMGLGNLAFVAGNYDEAKRHFQKALGLKRDFFFAWNNLALTLMKLDRHKEAKEAMLQAAKFAPKKYHEKVN